MRKLVAVLTALLVAAPVAQAAAAPALPLSSRAGAEDATLFAGGGTQLSNGYFFPGTAFYEDGEYVGVPLQVEEGSNVNFVNLDHFVVAGGGHKVVSYERIKRRGKKVPLFASKLIDGPGETVMKTSHVEPGVYPFFCPVHSGMNGQLEVR